MKWNHTVKEDLLPPCIIRIISSPLPLSYGPESLMKNSKRELNLICCSGLQEDPQLFQGYTVLSEFSKHNFKMAS